MHVSALLRIIPLYKFSIKSTSTKSSESINVTYFPFTNFSPVFLANPKPAFFLCTTFILLSCLASFSHNSPLESVDPSFTIIISMFLYV